MRVLRQTSLALSRRQRGDPCTPRNDGFTNSTRTRNACGRFRLAGPFFLVLLLLPRIDCFFSPTFGCPLRVGSHRLFMKILASQKQTSMTRLNSIEIDALVLTRRSDQHLSPAVFRCSTYETAPIWTNEAAGSIPVARSSQELRLILVSG
jgi:hypothetical protein